jgi:hypothetical protein
MFDQDSRYYRVADTVYHAASGREIAYKRLRLLPAPPALRTHLVAPEDRLDLIAHRHLGVAEQSWRVADANAALLPSDLVVVGRRLRIPNPGA